MNKKLIILALLLTSCTVMADESKSYVKVGAGINRILPHSFYNDEFRGKVKLARTYPLFTLGIGYQCADTIRTELVLNHHFMFNSYENTRNRDNDLFKVTYKTKIDTLMVNAYKDIAMIGIYTPFIGGGIGISNIKEKAVGVGIAARDGITYGLQPSSARRVNRLNYKLSAGVDIKLSDNVKAELAYNFFDLGYNRPKIIDGIDSVARRNYRVHNVTTSIRYSL